MSMLLRKFGVHMQQQQPSNMIMAFVEKGEMGKISNKKGRGARQLQWPATKGGHSATHPLNPPHSRRQGGPDGDPCTQLGA